MQGFDEALLHGAVTKNGIHLTSTQGNYIWFQEVQWQSTGTCWSASTLQTSGNLCVSDKTQDTPGKSIEDADG